MKAGIEAFHACASFVDASTLRIGYETVRARNLVNATSAQTRRLGILGEEPLTTSEASLNLDQNGS